MIPAAFFESDPPSESYTPLGLRAPEQIFGDPASKAADIWAFGVLVFEFLSGHPAIEFTHWKGDLADDDHLLQLNDFIGPLPENLHQRWARSSSYFTSERVQYSSIDLDEEDNPILDGADDTMEKLFDKFKPASRSVEEDMLIKALVRRTLQYDPAKRPTASELLQDPWFTTDFERVFTEEVFFIYAADSPAFTNPNRRSP